MLNAGLGSQDDRPDQRTVAIFDRVRILKIFRGYEGVVAYVGTEGVSVAVVGVDDFDDYLPLKWDEFELIR